MKAGVRSDAAPAPDFQSLPAFEGGVKAPEIDAVPSCGELLGQMRPLPLWTRLLLGVDRYANRGFHLYERLRDEMLLGRLHPGLHAALTARAYAGERAAYLPGGARFEAGLFDWEKVIFEQLRLPPRARVLLGAAGGGRELAALLALGHEVVAFEPNEALLDGARAIAAPAGAGVLQASLEDLVSAAVDGTGPLGTVKGPFDMVLLGWVSLSHLTHPDEHRALLRAIRKLFPGAPVVASFLVRAGSSDGSAPAKSSTARALFRRGYSPALAYLPRAGVVYRFSREELAALASETGYALRHLDTTRDGYAIFEPHGAAPARE
jgi:hypothetical protein